MFRKVILFASLAIVAMVTVRSAADDPQQPTSTNTADSGSTIIHNVRVFDGKSIHENLTVTLRDGRIASVEKSPIATERTASTGATVIDGEGFTLLPGLIDAHTHVIVPTMLEQALHFGVTTELDMFTDPKMAAGLRNNEADNRADLRSAGTLCTAPGGHGTQFGLKIPTLTKPEEANAFVEARIKEGSDYIKIVMETGDGIGLKFNSLDAATVAALVKAAHEHDKLAVVHVGSAAEADAAIKAGADGLVHLFIDKPAVDGFVERCAEQKSFVIPTLTVLESVCGSGGGKTLSADERLQPLLEPAEREHLATGFAAGVGTGLTLDHAHATIRALHDAGVDILAGSDAPNPGTLHGASIHREMELLVAAGLKPVEALRAATALPAERFGLADRGRIGPGMRADLLLVKGDPGRDITATRDIVAIWKHGVRFNLDEWKAEVVRRSKPSKSGLPAGFGDGLVSDFEGAQITSAFGAGWHPSTDSLQGGTSTVAFERTTGGANGSTGALRITGNCVPMAGRQWSGVMFFPAAVPMTPADLSGAARISFMAQGDGKNYHIMIFDQSRGFMPSVKNFKSTNEWTQHEFSISDFDGLTGKTMMGVFFGAAQDTGTFELLIDDVRFIK